MTLACPRLIMESIKSFNCYEQYVSRRHPCVTSPVRLLVAGAPLANSAQLRMCPRLRYSLELCDQPGLASGGPRGHAVSACRMFRPRPGARGSREQRPSPNHHPSTVTTPLPPAEGWTLKLESRYPVKDISRKSGSPRTVTLSCEW